MLKIYKINNIYAAFHFRIDGKSSTNLELSKEKPNWANTPNDDKKKEQQQQKQQHEKIELNGLEKLRVEHIFNCTWFVNNAFILRTCGVSSPLFWLGKKEITHTNTHTHRPCESVIFPTNFPCMYLRQLRACSIYYSRWYVVLVVCV